MWKKAVEFFKRILPGGRRRAKGIPVESVISQFISNNLTSLTGGTPAVEATRIGLDEFEEILRNFSAQEGTADAGYILTAFPGRDHPAFSLFYPAGFISSYLEKVQVMQNLKPGAEALNALLTGIDGGLSQLIFTSPAPEGGPASEPFEKKSIVRAIEAWRPGDTGGLLWRASGCAIYRILAGQSLFIAMLDEAADESLRALLADDSGFIAMAQSEMAGPGAAPDAGSAPVTDSIAIHSPGEFLLGRLFLSPAAFHGERNFTSVFREAAVTRQVSRLTGSAGAWFKLEIESRTGSTLINYFFPEYEAENPGGSPDIAKGAFGVLVRDAVKFLSGQTNTVPVKVSAAAAGVPGFPENAPLIVLSADVSVQNLIMPCRVVIQNTGIAPLLKNLLYPREMELLRMGSMQLLKALYLLNRALLRKNTGIIFRNAVTSASSPVLLKSGAARQILFHEFAGLLEDRDVRLILQNHLIRELEPASFGSLLCYYETVVSAEGDKQQRLVRFADSGEGRLKSFLPESYRLEWERNAQLGNITGSENEAGFIERNTEIMKGIYRAVRNGRLLLSERARYVLKTGFYGVLRKEFDRILDEAKAKNVPFAELKALPKKALQELLMHVDNRIMCLALIGRESEMDFLAGNISRRRLARLKSDFEYYNGRYRMDLIDSEDVLAAMESVRKSASELLEKPKK